MLQNTDLDADLQASNREDSHISRSNASMITMAEYVVSDATAYNGSSSIVLDRDIDNEHVAHGAQTMPQKTGASPTKVRRTRIQRGGPSRDVGQSKNKVSTEARVPYETRSAPHSPRLSDSNSSSAGDERQHVIQAAYNGDLAIVEAYPKQGVDPFQAISADQWSASGAKEIVKSVLAAIPPSYEGPSETQTTDPNSLPAHITASLILSFGISYRSSVSRRSLSYLPFA